MSEEILVKRISELVAAREDSFFQFKSPELVSELAATFDAHVDIIENPEKFEALIGTLPPHEPSEIPKWSIILTGLDEIARVRKLKKSSKEGGEEEEEEEEVEEEEEPEEENDEEGDDGPDTSVLAKYSFREKLDEFFLMTLPKNRFIGFPFRMVVKLIAGWHWVGQQIVKTLATVATAISFSDNLVRVLDFLSKWKWVGMVFAVLGTILSYFASIWKLGVLAFKFFMDPAGQSVKKFKKAADAAGINTGAPTGDDED